MLTQKLYKNGNSVAVTVPNSFLKRTGLSAGDEVIIEENNEDSTLLIKIDMSKKNNKKITPKFFQWLEKFNKEYAPALQELAKK